MNSVFSVIDSAIETAGKYAKFLKPSNLPVTEHTAFTKSIRNAVDMERLAGIAKAETPDIAAMREILETNSDVAKAVTRNALSGGSVKNRVAKKISQRNAVRDYSDKAIADIASSMKNSKNLDNSMERFAALRRAFGQEDLSAITSDTIDDMAKQAVDSPSLASGVRKTLGSKSLSEADLMPLLSKEDRSGYKISSTLKNYYSAKDVTEADRSRAVAARAISTGIIGATGAKIITNDKH